MHSVGHERGQRSERNKYGWAEEGFKYWRRTPRVLPAFVRLDARWVEAVEGRRANSADWAATDWITGKATLIILHHEGLARAA
jgi:hypothetical protein